ncbi:MAG TPA: ATP-dependent DNA ligase [Caulobacteraceae bacterium]|jgi:ATP-dependent DNA ligase|nr:ATP-dependent DNA ligase [Caulobacteraceae bacterium]
MGLRAARPMEAQTAAQLPTGSGWWFEPKWDGFRCIAFRDGEEVILQAKSGKPLTRFFPEVAQMLAAVAADRFVLDGELLIRRGERYSFEALQLRLHPAESRIRRLAESEPATLAVFDMLIAEAGEDLRQTPLGGRLAAVKAFLAEHGSARLVGTPGTGEPVVAQGWLDSGRFEGVVAKRLDGAYAEGERTMLKVKRVRTADCVVGGFRYASKGGRDLGSLLLGLYDAKGRLNHVGFTSGFAGVDRAALARTLESLKGGPGFTGDAPGGPSRWSTERSTEWTPVRPELVVEVSYDHVSGGRFRHGTRLLRLRPDKAPAQCTMDQIAPACSDPGPLRRA